MHFSGIKNIDFLPENVDLKHTLPTEILMVLALSEIPEVQLCPKFLLIR